MRLLCLLLLAFWQNSAQAELLFNGQPTGMSELYNFNPNAPDLGFEVAGGLAGTCASGTNTCNSCQADWILNRESCNPKRITPTTELVLSFSSTDKFGTPRLTTTILNEQAVPTNSPQATTAPNQITTLRISWANICAAFDGGTSACAIASDNQQFRVGIDGDNDGLLDNTSDDDYVSFTIHVVNPSGTAFETPTPAYDGTNFAACTHGGLCNFTLSKGDEKANISDIQVTTSGLSIYKYIMFFCAEGTVFSDINSVCTGNDRVAISGSGLAQDFIEGLSNGITYVFRAATVDIAGNIGLFLSIDDPARQQVTPENVVGLFEENSCFIATAAYGSPMEKHVKVLRSFRDRVLLKTSVGQLFVKGYYTLSPPLAKWIAQSPTRRSVTRVLLTPIVLLATFIMESPWLFLFLILCAVGSFLFLLRQRREPIV